MSLRKLTTIINSRRLMVFLASYYLVSKLQSIESFTYHGLLAFYWLMGHLLVLCITYNVALHVISYLANKLQGNIDTSGRAVLITGCDTGFGYMAALSLNTVGFRIYATCLNDKSEGALSLRKNATNPEAMRILKMDVTKEEDVDRVFHAIAEDLRRDEYQLWSVVNNAGVSRLGKTYWGSIDYHYRSLYEVNTLGTVRVTNRFRPLIRESGGRYVFITSMASRLSLPLMASYCMSKAALVPFTEILRNELLPESKVITIEPYFYTTPMTTFSSLRNMIDDISKTSDSKSAGEVERTKRRVLKKIGTTAKLPIIGSSRSVNEVIEAISSAISSPYPNEKYACGSLLIRLHYEYIAPLTPGAVLDSILAVVF